MERQHSVPILLSSSSGGAEPLEHLSERGGGVSEAFIRDLVHQHPVCLPITEIDAMFSGTVSICTELNTPAGPRMQALAQSGGTARGREPNSRLWQRTQSLVFSRPAARGEQSSQARGQPLA